MLAVLVGSVVETGEVERVVATVGMRRTCKGSASTAQRPSVDSVQTD